MINSKQLAIALVIINIIAFIYGIYYYKDQIARVDLSLLLFAVDSPMNAILFGAVIALALFGFKNDLLTSLAAIGNIKYGLWTMFVILFQGSYFLAPEIAGTYIILFVAHIGQLLQGLYISDISGLAKKSGRIILIILVVWVLLNDYMDYMVGTRPLIPEEGMNTIAIVTVLISLISVGIVYVLSSKRRDLFKSFGILRKMKSDLF